MTEIIVQQGSVLEAATELLVVNLFEGVSQPGGATGAVDDALQGAISELIAAGDLTGKAGEAVLAYPRGGLPARRVLVVYPVAAIKWIAVYDAAGERLLRRRKSPRRGRAVELFSELVYLGELVAHPCLSFEVALVEVEELRRDDGQGSWRRQGVSISERRLVRLLDTQRFDDPASLVAMLPSDLPDPFTNRELLQRLGVSVRLANKITYCLRQAGCLSLVGRAGRAHLFSRDRPAADG